MKLVWLVARPAESFPEFMRSRSREEGTWQEVSETRVVREQAPVVQCSLHGFDHQRRQRYIMATEKCAHIQLWSDD